MKIAYIPLPFPYAQTCDFLLIIHTLIVPMITSQWVNDWAWAFVFTLVQVVVLWSLNLVALEIENPFGKDANDMDGGRMQEEINRHLLLLLCPKTEATPRLSTLFDRKSLMERSRTSNFEQILSSAKRTSVVIPKDRMSTRTSDGEEDKMDKEPSGGRSTIDRLIGNGLMSRLSTSTSNSTRSNPQNLGQSLGDPPEAKGAASSQGSQPNVPRVTYKCKECSGSLQRVSAEDPGQACSHCSGSNSVVGGGVNGQSEMFRCKSCQRHICAVCACPDFYAKNINHATPRVSTATTTPGRQISHAGSPQLDPMLQGSSTPRRERSNPACSSTAGPPPLDPVTGRPPAEQCAGTHLIQCL